MIETNKITEDELNFMPSRVRNFVRNNKVYILGDFDKTISTNVIPYLIELIESLQFVKDAEIEFYINSNGGYACELMGLLTMIDTAKKMGIKIKTYNIGVAYSCGSLLAVVGDYRYMYRYADNLPHLGQAYIFPTTFEQLNRGAQHVSDWFNTIMEIYATHTKIPRKELAKILKDDGYHMGCTECMKYGFCDEII